MKAVKLSIILTLFLIFTSQLVYSQWLFYLNADSVGNKLQFLPKQEKLITLNTLSDFYRSVDISKAIEYGLEAYTLSVNSDDVHSKINCLLNIAQAYYSLGIKDSSQLFIEKAKQFADSIKYPSEFGQVMIIEGSINRHNKQYINAFDKFQIALQKSQETNDLELKTLSLFSIGYLYATIKEYDKANEYFLQTIESSKISGIISNEIYTLLFLVYSYRSNNQFELAEKTLQEANYLSRESGDLYGLINCNIQLGDLLVDKNNLDSALTSYLTARDMLHKLNIYNDESIVSTKIAHLYSLKGDFSEQEKYTLEVLELRKKVGNKTMIGSAYTNLGSAYLSQNKLNEALLNFNNAISILTETKEYSLIKYAYSKLTNFYLQTGEFDKAYQNITIYNNYNDSVIKIENLNEVYKYQFKYELESKENDFRNEQIKKKAINVYFLSFGAGILFITGLILGKAISKNFKINSTLKDTKSFQEDIIKFLRGKLINELDLKLKKQIELEESLVTEKEFNRLKNKFISLVSHEFRTPLSNISINLTKLRNISGTNNLLTKTDKYFDRIDSVTNKLSELMNDILVIGKLDAGKIDFKPIEIDIIDLINNIIDNLLKIWNTSEDIKVIIEGEQKTIMADKMLMTLTIENVLSNALKYSERKPPPIVKIIFKENNLIITIIDNGIGIPEEDIPKLFQAFFRAKNSLDFEGTGLGLLIVKQFMEMHKGSIEVKSKLNVGTEISLILPGSNV